MLWNWKICSKMKLNHQKSHYEVLVNTNQTFWTSLFVCFYGPYILTEYIENTVYWRHYTFNVSKLMRNKRLWSINFEEVKMSVLFISSIKFYKTFPQWNSEQTGYRILEDNILWRKISKEKNLLKSQTKYEG